MKSTTDSYKAGGANKRIIRRRRGRTKTGKLDMRARTSARNAKPKKILLMGHATTSVALRRGVLDLRSRSGKAYRAICTELTAHVGGEPSGPQRALIDQAARLCLMSQFAWAELWRSGPFRKNGELVPAFDAYRRSAADARSVFVLLGLARHTKEVPTLQDYLKKGNADGKAKGNADEA